MKILIELLPPVLLVVYGQLIIKWRVMSLAASDNYAPDRWDRLATYLSDPFILSSYLAQLASAMVWMFVIERHPLSLAFPLYIGLTVLTLVVAGVFLFGEQITLPRVAAVVLIVAGVTIGSRT